MSTVAEFVAQHEIKLEILPPRKRPHDCRTKLLFQGKELLVRRIAGPAIAEYPDASEMMWHFWHDAHAALMSEAEFRLNYESDMDYRRECQEVLAQLKSFLGEDLTEKFLTECEAD